MRIYRKIFMKMHKTLVCVIVIFFVFIALRGFAADFSSAYVQARAGLQPVLTLTCTDVDFSVWRVPVRTGINPTTITLSVEANHAAAWTSWRMGGNAMFVSWASGHPVANAGTCVVTGSNSPGQRIQVSISNNIDLALGGAARGGLNLPVDSGALRADLNLVEDSVEINAQGQGSFRIVGRLLIPAVIVRENYGGYSAMAVSSGNVATVTVTDLAAE